MAKNKLMIIEESVLIAMAGNPNFVREFGFLKGLQKLRGKKTGCGKCNRTATRRVALVNGTKQTLATMGAEKKRRLKKLLNADKVRLRVANAGKVTEYTF